VRDPELFTAVGIADGSILDRHSARLTPTRSSSAMRAMHSSSASCTKSIGSIAHASRVRTRSPMTS
jgi:hypothetical protein